MHFLWQFFGIVPSPFINIQRYATPLLIFIQTRDDNIDLGRPIGACRRDRVLSMDVFRHCLSRIDSLHSRTFPMDVFETLFGSLKRLHNILKDCLCGNSIRALHCLSTSSYHWIARRIFVRRVLIIHSHALSHQIMRDSYAHLVNMLMRLNPHNHLKDYLCSNSKIDLHCFITSSFYWNAK